MHDCVGVKVPDMIFNAHLLCAASLLSLQQQTFFFSKWCFKCFSSAVAPVKHVHRGTPRGGLGRSRGKSGGLFGGKQDA